MCGQVPSFQANMLQPRFFARKKSCAAQQPFCFQLMLLHGCALGERSSGGI